MPSRPSRPGGGVASRRAARLGGPRVQPPGRVATSRGPGGGGRHGGRVPTGLADLQRLPGVGPYTAAAVASIAGRQPVPAIDVNARRIVARVAFGAGRRGRLDRRHRRDRGEVGRSQGSRCLEPGVDGSRQGALPGGPALRACPLADACRFVRAGRTPVPAARRQSRFEGSMRQVRGGVVDVLRARPSAGVAGLARSHRRSRPIGSRRPRRAASATGWFGAPGARIGSRTDVTGVSLRREVGLPGHRDRVGQSAATSTSRPTGYTAPVTLSHSSSG